MSLAGSERTRSLATSITGAFRHIQIIFIYYAGSEFPAITIINCPAQLFLGIAAPIEAVKNSISINSNNAVYRI